MNGSDAHFLHVALHGCATGFHLLVLNQGSDSARPIEWILCIDGVNTVFDVNFLRRCCNRPIIQTGAANAQKVGLSRERHLKGRGIEQCNALAPSQAQNLFFSTTRVAW